MQPDLNANRNLAAIRSLPYLLGKARGKLTVAIKQAQAMRQPAKIARSQPQPAAGDPSVCVEAFESDRVKPGQPLRLV